MNTKLTLNLDKEIIFEAKNYAKDHKVSLSKLIENYLNSLTKESKRNSTVSPLILMKKRNTENTSIKNIPNGQDFCRHKHRH
jgi:hypothetical protein